MIYVTYVLDVGFMVFGLCIIFVMLKIFVLEIKKDKIVLDYNRTGWTHLVFNITLLVAFIFIIIWSIQNPFEITKSTSHRSLPIHGIAFIPVSIGLCIMTILNIYKDIRAKLER